ncbi:uncharacterized protein LOC131927721 [Physella acuta]|uniref:uncharacterized protein LOC131927721 n=1 Tax=Physella acuta TaxID=109671 RepID=UPI0027DE01F1|nr:uncharacterized protein LOC131927721 [Physella acuta]
MRESTQASNIREEHTAHPHALPASKAASHSTDASKQQNHHYTHGNSTEITEKDLRSPEAGGTMTRHQTMLAQPPQPTGAHRPMKHEPDEDEDDAASTCSSQSSANKSHFGPPSLSSPRAGAPHVLSTIASWSKDEVSSWLRNHHLDKICKNLSNLDAKGLQRMAFEYHRDTDAFYTRVKKTLGLTVFQTLVICRGMKELLGCEDS